ncbi:MAG: FAD-dependent oxidoreductase, partial [Spirochaetaceae bacterium]|nr:FAD-dependent oxidoreductase [Spirochaetaceae bacterium]
MFDLIIIGAGPSGYTAAFEAKYLNKSVLLIEKNELGGTCLNVGCIPTKSLLHKSEEYYNALNLSDFEVKVKDSFYKTLMSYKESVIDKEKKGLAYLIKKNEITYVKGIAVLVDKHTVKVENIEYNGENILLCTGSIPLIPNIEGINNCVFSDEILSMDYSKIDNIIIIGGGFIGVEIATIFSNLGKSVTI